MVSLDFLKRIEVLKGLDDNQLGAVHGCSEVAEFEGGTRLFGESEEADHLWAMMEGQVDLRFDLQGRPTSDDNTISSLSEGQTFGWSSLVPPHKYRLSSYSVSDNCKVIRFNRKNLIYLFEKDAQIGYLVMSNLAGIVGKRFHQLQDEVVKRKGYDVMFGW